MNATPHHTRAHAQWSASSAARNWNCPGAMAMATIVPEGKSSIYADRGTAAHEIAEKALRSGTQCVEYLGTSVQTTSGPIEIDEELADAAQAYVDYVRSLPEGGELHLEMRYTLDAIEPPFEAGGTCDAVYILVPMIEVVDLKTGTHAVNAEENKQLRQYALMALLNSGVSGIRRVKTTIVQPRAYHANGRIRSEEFDAADLLQWGADLIEAMGRSKAALDAFEKIEGSRVKFDEWAAEHLRPGSCSFCPAEGICPARRKHVLAITPQMNQDWFEDPTLTSPPPLSNAPKPQSLEELAHILNGLDALDDWANSVRAYAMTMAEGGAEIPGWMLTEKIGNRAWRDEGLTIDTLRRYGFSDDKIFTKKLVSPAQADKLLGKRKDEIVALVERPIRGHNLVAADKSERKPAEPLVNKYVDKL